MSSFYGGRPGPGFVIKKTFINKEEMDTAFSKGYAYTEVKYGEYALIDTTNVNSVNYSQEHGDIYQRTLEGAKFIGNVRGFQGTLIRWCGKYESSVTYYNNNKYIDAVYYEDSAYIRDGAETAIGQIPSVSSSYWTPISLSAYEVWKQTVSLSSETKTDFIQYLTAYGVWLRQDGNAGKTEADFIKDISAYGEWLRAGNSGDTNAFFTYLSAYGTWSRAQASAVTESDFFEYLNAYQTWARLNNKTIDETSQAEFFDYISAYGIWSRDQAAGTPIKKSDFYTAITGPTGPQGVMGPTGATGPTGSVGPTGAAPISITLIDGTTDSYNLKFMSE